MAGVLVTGGTGVLGRQLVPVLLERGHEVRVMARHPAAVADGAELLIGDVRSGDGLGAAIEDVDTVIHAATSPRWAARKTEVAGIRNVLTAMATSRAHLIYVSIVGVDRNRLPYYKAKVEAERVVESSTVPWTIQRATQFHDLLDLFLSYPLFITTPNLAFQVVDTRDVSARLADLVDAGPGERAPDFGGPDVISIRELAASRREISGRRARLLRVPRAGPIRDFDNGHHLCPDQRNGHRTWQDWLRTTSGARSM